VAPISGTLALLERLMIGRWISLPHSSACCIQVVGDGKVKTSFGGPSKKRLFNVKSFYSVLVCIDGGLFLRRVFGRLRFHLRVTFFLLGRRL
jgi:hypothetical protein